MIRWPIRLKLTMWFAGSLAAILVVLALTIDVLIQRELIERLDFELAEEAEELILELKLAPDRDAAIRQVRLRFAEHETFESRILDREGHVLFTSPELGSNARLPVPAGTSSSDSKVAEVVLPTLGRSRYLSRGLSGPEGDMVVQVAMSMEQNLADLIQLRRLGLSVLPVVLIATCIGGYWLAGYLLRPIALMTSTAARISAEQHGERLEVMNPHDELGRLAKTLNEMIIRLETANEEQRQFTADAAHELRTPLAVMRTTAEIALRLPRSPAQYEMTLQTIIEEVQRLTSLTQQLLDLARVSATTRDLPLIPLAPAVVLDDVIRELRPLAGQKRQALESSLTPGIFVLADEDRFHRAGINLIENAIKYTPEEGTIRLTNRIDGDTLILLIQDTGPGVPHDDLPRLFERFYRADPSRNRASGGAGLGLSICRAFIESFGGTILAFNHEPNGLTIEIRLPMMAS